MKPGYSGHVPRAFNTKQFVPGFSELTTSKFSRAAVSMISASSYGATTKDAASSSLKKSSYIVPSRAKAAAKSNNPPKRFVAQSLNASEYVNFMEKLLTLENLSDEQIEAAFNEVDVDSSGYICKKEIRILLKKTFDTIPDERMVASLTAHFDANKDGKITLAELSSGLRAVAAQKRGQMSKGTRDCAPSWVRGNRSQVGAVSNSVTLSMQRTDLGSTGNALRDMESGTQKATKHLPGYSGFIPKATTSAAAVKQSRADNCRYDKNRNILNETYAPKIRVDKEMRYGSMQTTNSKRTSAVDQRWKDITR